MTDVIEIHDTTYNFYIDAQNPQTDSAFTGLKAKVYTIFVEDAREAI